MARTPAVAGRPAQQRKQRSSGGGAGRGAQGALDTGAAASSSSNGTPRTLVTKAFKRAQKRAQLLAKTSSSVSGRDTQDEHAKARALLVGPTGTISKSALRRRKRKARDELARDDGQGRRGGVGELQSAVAELEGELASDEEDGDDDQEAGYANAEHTDASGSRAGSIKANQRRRVLALEQSRQHVILNNPSFKASPFAALREHARNSMAQQPQQSSRTRR